MKKGRVLIGIGAALLCVIGIAAGVSAAMGRGFNPLGLLPGQRGTASQGTLPLVIEITRPVSGDSRQAALVTEAVITPEPVTTAIPVTEALTTEEVPVTEAASREETTEEESTEETEESTVEETTEAETSEDETTEAETEEATEESTEATEESTEKSTEESATSEPTTPEPATPEPTTLEPATPESTTPEPTTPESTTPEPATPEPTTPEPATQAQEAVPEELRQHLAVLGMNAEQLAGTWLSGIPGIMGRDGMNWHTPEDHKYTPIGYFGLGPAYGEREWQETGLEYYQIQSEDYYVVDPNSKWYNQLYKSHYDDKDWEYAEEMISLLEYYEYCIYVQHNINPIIPNEGSAIFVHIDRLDNSTSGCIGVEKWVMEALFKWMRADADPHIFLYPGQ